MQLLALADAGPFRRMDAARSIGSAGYADQAITQLLTSDLITVVGQGRHKHYQRAVHTTHATEASLEAARTLLRNHPGPLTALQFGPHREAADLLVTLGEAERVMVGFLAIYSRPATRHHSPDHHPVSDDPSMHSAISWSGIVLGTRTDGTVRLGLPDREIQVQLPPGSPAAQPRDYVWVELAAALELPQRTAARALSCVVLPEADLCRTYLTHLPGFSTTDVNTVLHLCASSLEPLRALGGWREQLSARTVQILTAAGEHPLEMLYELSALLLLGLSREQAAPLAQQAGIAGRAHHNPYILSGEIGFPAADKLARARGGRLDDPNRLAALTAEVLRRARLFGHAFLPLAELETQLAQTGCTSAQQQAAIDLAEAQQLLQRDQDRIYLAGGLQQERDVARLLREHLARPTRPSSGSVPMAQLNTAQQQALHQALHAPLSLLTGPPGSGKSHMLRALCEAAEQRGLKVALAAPTGKAALRLSQATDGRPTSTIHRLLGAHRNGFQQDLSRPLDAELVVIDEASMLGDELLLQLLKALKGNARLLLVGDAAQIGPIEHGAPFQHLLQRAPTTRLTQVYRHGPESRVYELAQALLQGDDVEWEAEVGSCTDAAQAVRLAGTSMLLTPTRAGPFGAAALNEASQAQRGFRGGTDIREGFAHVGDPVLQTVNNYEQGVFNGHLGVVLETSRSQTVVDFDGHSVIYRGLERMTLQPAYALTIHRAQGSEWPEVSVVLHEHHQGMLSRTIAYTAVTRAREQVTLLGSPLAWEVAAARRTPGRHSYLAERLGH
ncbi:hypothetical protein GCM10008957_36920 [Deinococcus ruber]|uniref:AAA+ ATPase domain-containing protein n=1 Tax=Deinococcus ruber TaxID=1848197 RepID=A0A918FAG2_9DEIO|nr:hypothetical protein GCM10008957_36920 [Deinococcus ruber]